MKGYYYMAKGIYAHYLYYIVKLPWETRIDMMEDLRKLGFTKRAATWPNNWKKMQKWISETMKTRDLKKTFVSVAPSSFRQKRYTKTTLKRIGYKVSLLEIPKEKVKEASPGWWKSVSRCTFETRKPIVGGRSYGSEFYSLSPGNYSALISLILEYILERYESNYC